MRIFECQNKHGDTTIINLDRINYIVRDRNKNIKIVFSEGSFVGLTPGQFEENKYDALVSRLISAFEG